MLSEDSFRAELHRVMRDQATLLASIEELKRKTEPIALIAAIEKFKRKKRTADSDAEDDNEDHRNEEENEDDDDEAEGDGSMVDFIADTEDEDSDDATESVPPPTKKTKTGGKKGSKK